MEKSKLKIHIVRVSFRLNDDPAVILGTNHRFAFLIYEVHLLYKTL